MAGLDFKSAIGKAAREAKEKSAPPRARGPYRACHSPGVKDNEWEVRDGDGILIRQIVGADFGVAKRRAEQLAGELNKAWERGRGER